MGKNIAIDVGAHSVRAVEVAFTGKKAKILKAAEVPLPRGVVVSGDVRDPDALTEALRMLWKLGKFTTKNVIVGIGGPNTLVRQMDLPWEDDEVFRDSLPLRVGAELPVDPAEMTLDFYPLETYLSPAGVPMQRALVVASMNYLVENVAHAMGKAGLKLKRADFVPFALIRAAHYLCGPGGPVAGVPKPGEEFACEVVVDISAQATTIAIHHAGRPLFVRSVTGGTEAITRALADQLKVPMDDAEQIKRAVGISGINDADLPALEEGPLTAQQKQIAQYIVNAIAGSLVQVVRESVEYFLSVSPEITGVSRVLVAGGGALIPGYLERLSSDLRAPAEAMNVLARHGRKTVVKGAEESDPRFSVAAGLALEVK